MYLKVRQTTVCTYMYIIRYIPLKCREMMISRSFDVIKNFVNEYFTISMFQLMMGVVYSGSYYGNGRILK